MKLIELQLYKTEYFDSINRFSLPEDQLLFTALPNQMAEITHKKHPVVILCGMEPVGFFVLHSSDRVKEYTDNPDAMLLTAFSVNHVQQGKGYAFRGMNQLKQFLNQHFPKCNEVVLAVNKRNIPAQKLYQKVGFTDTGRRKIGKIGEQLILSLKV
jgi:RimJ/RimL family protein N-acetyltransferase